MLLGVLLAVTVPIVSSAQTNSWIDPDTGHRVIQLTAEPGRESLYFNLNPFTPDGKQMVISTPSGISLINLQTGVVEPVVTGGVRIIMVGHKTGQIFYTTADRNESHGHGGGPRHQGDASVAKLARGQSVSAVNADETLLAGTLTDAPPGPPTVRVLAAGRTPPRMWRCRTLIAA